MVISATYSAQPDQFVRRPPSPAAQPTAVWINPLKSLSPQRTSVSNLSSSGVSDSLPGFALSTVDAAATHPTRSVAAVRHKAFPSRM